jgi:hypothetical protein
MFIVRIILLDENHSDGVFQGCEVEEIITTVIRREEKWGTCERQFQSFESFVGSGIRYELRPFLDKSCKSNS